MSLQKSVYQQADEKIFKLLSSEIVEICFSLAINNNQILIKR